MDKIRKRFLKRKYQRTKMLKNHMNYRSPQIFPNPERYGQQLFYQTIAKETISKIILHS